MLYIRTLLSAVCFEHEPDLVIAELQLVLVCGATDKIEISLHYLVGGSAVNRLPSPCHDFALFIDMIVSTNYPGGGVWLV